MYHSLGASSKQLTHFFDAQKNLSFSLENNNIINTYIHSNDREPVRSEPISPPLNYNVTFSKFNKIDSSNQENNYSVSSWSSFTSDNSLFNSSFNFLLVLTRIKSATMLFSSVLLPQGFDKHLNSLNVFSPLSSLFYFISQTSTVDSLTNSNIDFENLLLHFAYDSSSPFFSLSLSFSSSSSFPINKSTVSTT
jgi:hypothetical protein